MDAEILDTIGGISDDALMALLHFSPASRDTKPRSRVVNSMRKVYTSYDVKPFLPQNPLIFQDVFNDGRLYSSRAADLMADPSDQFSRFELLFIGGEWSDIAYRWNAVRIRKMRPRAFIRPGCDVFWDSCQRTVFRSGREDVMSHVFGWSKKRMAAISCPVPEHKHSIFQGCERSIEEEMTRTLVLMSSIVEDIKVNWSVSIRERSAFTLYSTEERIKELCDLRDAPMTDAGRRAAICHWVRAHKRKTSADAVDVRKHLRGITQFPLGDMQVTITPPTGFQIR